MQLGTKIKQLRTERQLSQEAVAAELQVSRQAVAKWENQSSLPSTANLLALCKLFGISMEELTEQEPPQMTQKKSKSHWYLAAITGVCILLSGLACLWQQKTALPPNVIGYADAATSILVMGTPAYFYVLYAVTAVLAVVTIWLFAKAGNKRREKQ